MSDFRTKLYMQHLHSLFWFLLTILSSLSLTTFPPIKFLQMQLLSETCPLFNINTLFDFLISLAYLYRNWLVIITSKSITHFTEKTVYFICRHSSQRAIILLSRYYIARVGTTMNYAKKSPHFYYHAYFFHKKNLIR